ncbi:MAG: DUF1622 domain-containing protein [Clostridia bacterium]|nr:DUF1622 domain-containing protein [Clostridia bacterium]
MLYDKISEVFELVVKYCILIIEFIGVAVLLFTVVRSIAMLVRHRNYVRLQLAEGIALALEFKMGGELLRTVIVREWHELLILGSIILLRAALTFLIHWEIRNEKKSGAIFKKEEADAKKAELAEKAEKAEKAE